MSEIRFRAAISFASGLVLALGLCAVALAWTNGTKNGEDVASSPWNGNDNPDGVTGSYSYLNGVQDFILNEWNEPGNDWVRTLDMDWDGTAETKLDNETSTHALDYEMRIHDQYFYNFVNNWQTNLPISKAPENENPIEELAQGYTEVDMEQDDPYRITTAGGYYWNQFFDSEKPPTSTRPDFYSEVEYCNKSYLNCVFDVTGWFEKVTLIQ